MAHTHGCPKCGTITVHSCTGRNAGAPDCQPVCEYDLDGGKYGDYCEDCYEQAMDEMEAEQRADAKALLPFRVGESIMGDPRAMDVAVEQIVALVLATRDDPDIETAEDMRWRIEEVLRAVAENMGAEAQQEIARLRGKWSHAGERCPQCGSGMQPAIRAAVEKLS